MSTLQEEINEALNYPQRLQKKVSTEETAVEKADTKIAPRNKQKAKSFANWANRKTASNR